MKRFLPILVLLALVATTTVVAQGNTARVRAVHASPDAPPVDVLVNDAITAFEDLTFPNGSEYATLPAGVYNVKVVPAGGAPETNVINADLNLFFNTDYTVVALNTLENIEPIVLEDSNRPIPPTRSKIRFVHASPDAPAVDIRVVNGPYLFQNVSFRGVGDYVTVPNGTYDLEVLVAGTEAVALELPGVSVAGGTTYTVLAVGFLDGTPGLQPQVLVDSISPSVVNANPRSFFNRSFSR